VNSDDWKALLEDEPANELLRFSLAKALLDERRWSEAVPHFRILIEDKPDYAIAWGFLARALLEAGDRDGARVACEKGLPVARAFNHDVPIEEIEAVLEELDGDF
jgi:predicted Zn-dependent protease